MNWSLKVYSAPTSEPVSLAEAKLHLRVDVTDDDTLISGLIEAAREWVQETARRALITQTLDYTLDAWPEESILELPRAPLISVTSIVYKDETGSETTFAASNYAVDTASEPGRIALKSGITWPTGDLYPVGGVRVRYVAGYGGAGNVPERYKQAIKLLIGAWYENREDILTTGAMPKSIPFGVQALCKIDGAGWF